MVIIIMLAAAGGYHDKMNPEGGCHEGRIGGRRPESMPRATLRNEALGQHYFSLYYYDIKQYLGKSFFCQKATYAQKKTSLEARILMQ